ncbi:GPW/gp25 family protein [Natronorarus salvus]|uniref:GPW/gp25 family protein n=1 Tax=Natronorarus salvus TaxID=3117733 RepID=UPI002F2651BC
MRDFLGRGWAFPVGTESSGEIRTATEETDIEQAIRLILSTSPGERVMRPDFGCGIHGYVFATIDTTTLTLIGDEVRDALAEWEPRIEVLSVDSDLADAATGRLEIEIRYRVRRTNNEFNLVYPFYLEGA